MNNRNISARAFLLLQNLRAMESEEGRGATLRVSNPLTLELIRAGIAEEVAPRRIDNSNGQSVTRYTVMLCN